MEQDSDGRLLRWDPWAAFKRDLAAVGGVIASIADGPVGRSVTAWAGVVALAVGVRDLYANLSSGTITVALPVYALFGAGAVSILLAMNWEKQRPWN